MTPRPLGSCKVVSISSGARASGPRQAARSNAPREDQSDRLGLQAARDERNDLRRGAIEPLLVIHQADERLLLGHLGEQAEHGQRDEEAIRRRPGTDTKRRPQRITLRKRQTLEVVEHRHQQLVQAGKGKLHLRLDTRGAHHPTTGCVLGHVFQQHRLPHSRFATHDQHPALTRGTASTSASSTSDSCAGP